MSTKAVLAILLLAWAVPSEMPAAQAPLPCLKEWATGKIGQWMPVLAKQCQDSRSEDWAGLIESFEEQIKDGSAMLAELTDPGLRRELSEAIAAWEEAVKLAKRELARVKAVTEGKPDPEAKPDPAAGPAPAQAPQGLQPVQSFGTVNPRGILEPHFKPMELSAIQKEYLRESTIQQTVFMLREDDDETHSYIGEARRFCEARGGGTTACMLAYANSHRSDVPDLYLSRRNAEHYLLAKRTCEDPTALLNAGTMLFFIPMYSLGKATNAYWERLFPDALTRFPSVDALLKSIDAKVQKPPGSLEAMLTGRAWVNSPGTLKESYWGYKGLTHCDQSQRR